MLQNSKEALEHKLMLRMISRIEDEPEISQRALSSHLGIAIGLVNAYLKRCVLKGWVKVQQAPSRRFAYYLTPKGFVEKTQLTAQYLASSFEFFRDSQNQCLELFQYCEKREWYRIILVGLGDLSKIAIQVVKSSKFTIIETIESEHNLGELSKMFECDAIIITDVVSPQETFNTLLQSNPEERILTLPLLHISRKRKQKDTV